MMDVRVKYTTRVSGANILAGDYTAARGNALADAVAQAVLVSGAGVDITKYPVEAIAKTQTDPTTGQTEIVGPDGYPVFEATSQYQSLASTPGLIAFWDFSEPRAPFVSKAGRGRLALVQGAGSKVTKGTGGPLANSLVFNGTSDYLRIAPEDVGVLNIGKRGGNEVTVIAWTKRNSGTFFVAGLWQEDKADPRRQYGLFESLPMYGGAHKSCMHVSKTGGSSPGLPYSRDYSANGYTDAGRLGGWIAGTYDGEVARSYIEGRFEPYENYTEPAAPNGQGLTYDKNPYAFPLGLNSVDCEFTVGAVKLTHGYSNFANGEIACLAVFDKALSQEEIAEFQNKVQSAGKGFVNTLYQWSQVASGVAALGCSAYRGATAINESSSSSGVFIRTNTGDPQQGFVYRGITSAAGIALFTCENVTPNVDTDNLRTFSLEIANGSTADQIRLAIKVGNNWYATNATYVSTANSSSGGDWSQSNIISLSFARTAALWRDVTLVPGSSLELGGAARSQPLPEGVITGWGVFSPAVPAANLRFRNQEFVTY